MKSWEGAASLRVEFTFGPALASPDTGPVHGKQALRRAAQAMVRVRRRAFRAQHVLFVCTMTSAAPAHLGSVRTGCADKEFQRVSFHFNSPA
jgi:hypothetical protein